MKVISVEYEAPPKSSMRFKESTIKHQDSLLQEDSSFEEHLDDINQQPPPPSLQPPSLPPAPLDVTNADHDKDVRQVQSYVLSLFSLLDKKK